MGKVYLLLNRSHLNNCNKNKEKDSNSKHAKIFAKSKYIKVPYTYFCILENMEVEFENSEMRCPQRGWR